MAWTAVLFTTYREQTDEFGNFVKFLSTFTYNLPVSASNNSLAVVFAADPYSPYLPNFTMDANKIYWPVWGVQYQTTHGVRINLSAQNPELYCDTHFHTLVDLLLTSASGSCSPADVIPLTQHIHGKTSNRKAITPPRTWHTCDDGKSRKNKSAG